MIHLLAEGDTVELVQHRLMEAFADAVGLRALGFGARVVDVLDREIEFVLVPLRIAAILAAAISQYPQQLDVMAIEEGNYSIVEQIGRGDRCLAIVELGTGNLGVGVDESLLIDAPDSLQVADIECILGAAIAWMLTLELAMGLLLCLGLFQRDDLGLGQHQAFLGAPGFQRLESFGQGLQIMSLPHATYATRWHCEPPLAT